MSQQRRQADYRNLEEVDVTSTRRDDGRAFVVSGYSPGSAALGGRAFPGDQKFPFVKDVPDVEGPIDLRDGYAIVDEVSVAMVNPLPFAATAFDYETSPEIDVRGIRQVLVFLRYYAGVDEQLAGEGVLSVIPEAAFFPAPAATEQQWMPIGVVNPVLNVPAIQPGFAFRHVFSTELRLDPGYTGLAPQPYTVGPFELTLAFDVGPYDVFRLRYADVVSNASTLYARAYTMR
jgi:hypothetical protein